MTTEIRRYVRSLGLDAYVVGGAVRDELLGIPHKDEDFLVPGVDTDGLRTLLAPHGRVEDLVVQDRLVGVRLHPSDQAVRELARVGIEFTPPRAERSTGPGHRDFEIVSSPEITVEQDMQRRDFTVNAMARRLADGALVDPFAGRADLQERLLRTVTPHSFSEDPLRILRGLRLVSQLGFRPTDETIVQMRANASGLVHVSPERIGGGLAADGRGELSKLLLGGDPGLALRLARDTGVLAVVIPEYGLALGYALEGGRQPVSLDEHVILVVEACAAAGAPLVVRLAALLHDLGKPEAAAAGADHAEAGAEIAAGVLRRLRYPTRVTADAVALIRAHAFHTDQCDALAARRFLAAHGDRRARWLVQLKRADLSTKLVPAGEPERLEQLAKHLHEQAGAPHRIADLALDGSDLISAGIPEGPAIGETLRRLLSRVVEEPALNDRETLLSMVVKVQE